MFESLIFLLVLGYLGLGVWTGIRRREGEAAERMGHTLPPRTRELVPAPEPPQGGWQALVGRRIESVVVTGHGGDLVRTQVFLVLDGNEHFEIFTTGYLNGNSRTYPGGLFDLLSYHCFGPNLRVYGPVEAPPPRVGG